MAGHERIGPRGSSSGSKFVYLNPKIVLTAANNTVLSGSIHVIYEPAVSPNVHISTCRSLDGTFMAFLVMHGNLLKTVWNPNLLAGDARQTRAAAMLSLLEATEDRIREMLLKSNGRAVKKGELKENKQSKKAENNNAKTADSDSERTSLDYGVKPTDKKERGFMPWRKSGNSFRSDSNYTRVGVILHPVFVVLIFLHALLYRRSGSVGD
jgi:hypothetical protein